MGRSGEREREKTTTKSLKRLEEYAFSVRSRERRRWKSGRAADGQPPLYRTECWAFRRTLDLRCCKYMFNRSESISQISANWWKNAAVQAAYQHCATMWYVAQCLCVCVSVCCELHEHTHTHTHTQTHRHTHNDSSFRSTQAKCMDGQTIDK